MRFHPLFGFILLSLIAVHVAPAQEPFWQHTGGPLGHMDVRSLASNANGHVFAGTWTDGRVYRTTNNGTAWTVCGDIPNTNPIMGLSVDHHGHIFASVYLRGMARSTDGGATWQMKNNGLASFTLRANMVDRQGDIWVATEAGIFCSTDDGESWASRKSGEFYLVFQDSTGAVLTQDPGYFYRSTDGGTSWSSSPTVPRFGLGGVHADGSYWGYVWGNVPDSRIVRSTDGGVTWVDMHSPVSWDGGTSAMMFTPQGDVFYARNGYNTGIVRSTDNGENWHIINEGLTTTTIISLLYHPGGYLFLGTGTAGVFRSVQPVVPQDISISLPDRMAIAGSTVEIPVNITNVSGWGICAYEFTLAFNSPDSIVSFDAEPITTGTLSGQGNWDVLVNAEVPNQVTVGAYGALPLTGQGALLKLKLTVSSAAQPGDSTFLRFNRFLLNSGELIPLLHAGSVAIRERVCGDADENGAVQAYDAALTLREALGPMSPPPPPLTDMGRLNADITLNGKVEAYDAALILRHVVGLTMPESTATCFGTEGETTTPDSLHIAGEVLDIDQGGDHTAVVVQFSNVPADLEVYSFAFEVTASASFDDTTSLTLPLLPEGSLATVHRLGNGHFRVGIINPYNVDVENVTLTLSAGHALSLNTITFTDLFLNNAPCGEITLTDIITEVKPPAAETTRPVSYDLIGAYPNPFNPSTRIVFQTPVSEQVHLEIYNAQGTRIKTLHFPQPGPGWHEVSWDGTNDLGQGVATGQYFCRMRAGSYIKTVRLLLLK